MKNLTIAFRTAIGLAMSIALLAGQPAAAGQDGWSNHLPGNRMVTLVGMNGEMTDKSDLNKNHMGSPDWNSCASIGAGACALNQTNDEKGWIMASAVLPLCDGSNTGYCVENVNIYQQGQEVTPAKYLGEAPGNKFDAQPEFNLPRGGGPLIFDAPGAPHAGGGTTYAVIANYVMGCSAPDYKCGHNAFYITVQPFTNGSNPLGYIGGERFDFAAGTRVGLSVQVPQEIGGWFTGRLKDPTIDIAAVKGKPQFSEITLDAESIAVNRLSVNVPNDTLTPQMKALAMPPDGSFAIESGFDTAISWVEELRPYAKDTATGQINVWQLKSIFLPETSCYPAGQVNGLVTTNAVGYSWNPPAFEDGYLNYKMGGLHYNKDGSLAHGTYDLIMRASVARCLYQFSSAPISATIQITAPDGHNEEIATSTVSEKNGWLKLAAYGFTFSSPTAKVKIQGEKEGSSTPSPSSDTKPVAKTATITCVKGKLVKKVTGKAPKCPAGYKKKS